MKRTACLSKGRVLEASADADCISTRENESRIEQLFAFGEVGKGESVRQKEIEHFFKLNATTCRLQTCWSKLV